MPKPTAFTARGQIQGLMKSRPGQWFSIAILVQAGFTASQVRYALTEMHTNGMVERRMVAVSRNRGGNYAYEYRWKP